MSIVRQEGKDTIIFASKEDHATPSTIKLPEAEPSQGLLLPNGEINWNCPCLGGVATGPCGLEFREAFSCFHYSTAEPKGSECYEAFVKMQTCMTKYPALYGNKDVDMGEVGEDDDDDDDKAEAEKEREPSADRQRTAENRTEPSETQQVQRSDAN